MKGVVLVIAAVAFLSFGGWAQGQQESQQSGLKTTIIEVKTLKCDTCATTIVRALRRIEGVKSVRVDTAAKTVAVLHHPIRVKLAILERAISYAGFDANNTKRNPKAYERLPECCK